MYLAQWPGADWCGALKESWFRVTLKLEEWGRNCSFLLREPGGTCLAASLGYLTDKAFNLHLLTHRPGAWDKYSPGFYLAYRLVREMLESHRAELFLFGPGEFDYKRTLLGEPLPVFRYETRTWLNLLGILKLRNRLRKERLRRQAASAAAAGGDDDGPESNAG